MSLVFVQAQIGFAQPASQPASGGPQRRPLKGFPQYRPKHFLRVNGVSGRIATNFVVAEVRVGGGVPNEIAVIVRPAEPTANARSSPAFPPILPHITDTTTTNYPCRFYRVLPIP